MEITLPPDAQLSTFNDENLLKLLSHSSGVVRARALPTIGARLITTPNLKEALFAAVENPTNLELEFYEFIKVAWVASLVILDYGDASDFLRLRELLVKWPQAEREGFLFYAKDHRNFNGILVE